MRVEMLKRLIAKRRMHDLASVTGAMNGAATQDVRTIELVPVLAKLLSKGAPTPRDARMLKLLQAWRANGGSRLDRNGDEKIDAPGAAILDAAWDRMSNAEFSGVLGPKLTDQLATLVPRFDQPPDHNMFAGWMGYMDKDFRTLLRSKVRGKYSRRYCGGGTLAGCRKAMWAALDAAGRQLTKQQGTPDPSKWRAPAEHLQFAPIPLYQMRYTNRPSGIQQVISFSGHR
jgi:hypothetical protein